MRKLVLITGAAKRIGRAIALDLAQQGWDVALHFHRSEAEALALREEITRLGRRAQCIGADLSDAAQVAGLMPRCADLLGVPSCLVNNASLFDYDTAADFSDVALQQHLQINLQAPLTLIRDYARLLPDGQTGCVINLLDQKVFNPNPDFFTYSVSKMALGAATKLLALSYAPRLRVNAIAPGLTLPSGAQTQQNFDAVHNDTPLARGSELADLTQAVRYLIEAGAVTGETLLVDGGQHLWPRKRDVMFGEP